MTAIDAIVLGVVEGVTEFLPVSSTAHLIIGQRLLGIESPSVFFTTVVQLGAVAALLLYELPTIRTLFLEFWNVVQKPQTNKSLIFSLQQTQAFGIVVATLPVVIVGFFLARYLENLHGNMVLIAIMSIVVGFVLMIAQMRAGKTERKVTTAKIGIMGLFQPLAIIPGVSRSGIVATGGMLQGMTLSQSLEYSFLLSLPALGLAGVYEIVTLNVSSLSGNRIAMTLIGTFVSFLSALVGIDVLRKIVRKVGFMPFVIYRIVFGLCILLLF